MGKTHNLQSHRALTTHTQHCLWGARTDALLRKQWSVLIDCMSRPSTRSAIGPKCLPQPNHMCPLLGWGAPLSMCIDKWCLSCGR